MNEISVNEVTRTQVIEFEKLMQHGEKIELDVKHHFTNGIYARELFIPKGVILTGRIHKYEHISILLKGDISVLIDGKVKRIQAPYTYISPAGIKRVMMAYEDCIWMTIHSSQFTEKDIGEIEDHYTVWTEEQYLDFLNKEPLLPFKD